MALSRGMTSRQLDHFISIFSDPQGVARELETLKGLSDEVDEKLTHMTGWQQSEDLMGKARVELSKVTEMRALAESALDKAKADAKDLKDSAELEAKATLAKATNMLIDAKARESAAATTISEYESMAKALAARETVLKGKEAEVSRLLAVNGALRIELEEKVARLDRALE